MAQIQLPRTHQSDEITHLIGWEKQWFGWLLLGEDADFKSLRAMLYCSKSVRYLAASPRLTEGITDGS
jgi:hypothetical protein